MAGISGEFFRQFALTIAASTIISAFNSLTLSPALCAILFKGHGSGTRERMARQTHAKKEALPRLGVVADRRAAGLLHARRRTSLTFWESQLPGGHGEDAPTGHASAAALWGVRLVSAAAGAAAGWFLAGLVNRALGAFFAAFNWVFDRVINAYGRTVALLLRIVPHRPAGLRRPDGADLPRVPGRSGRIHPRPGQGLSGGQCAVARRRQPGSFRQDHQADERHRPRCGEGPGRLAHDRPSRLLRLVGHQHQQRGRHVRHPGAL